MDSHTLGSPTLRHALRSGLRALALASIFLSAGAAAQPDARPGEVPEPVAGLIELYTEADSNCRLSISDDALTKASCAARSIYGAALNGENWCYGRQDEPNAVMEWHVCEPTSLRFDDEAGQ